MPPAYVFNRLAKLGLRSAAEAWKEEVKRRMIAEGANRSTANDAAWDEVWKHLKPVVERLEAEKEKARAMKEPEPPPQLPGLPANINEALDPGYTEPDLGRQIRDGLLWAAMEFVGVISDTEAGPVANLDAASTPPPNRFALFTLSTYALSPIEKRRDLISRAVSFAEKGHDVPEAAADTTTEDSFLDRIG